MNAPPQIAIAAEGQKILDKASLILQKEYTKLSTNLVKRTTTFNSYKETYNQNTVPQNMALILEPHVWPPTIPSNLTDALYAKEQATFAKALRDILEGRLAFLSADVINLQTQLATFTTDEDVGAKFLGLIPTLSNQPTYLQSLIWSFRLIQTRQNDLSRHALRKKVKIRFVAPSDDMSIDEDPFIDRTNDSSEDEQQSPSKKGKTSSSSSSASSTSPAASLVAPKKKNLPKDTSSNNEIKVLTEQVAALTKSVASLQIKFTGSPIRGTRDQEPSRQITQLPTDNAMSKRMKKKLNMTNAPLLSPPQQHNVMMHIPPQQLGQYQTRGMISQQQYPTHVQPTYNPTIVQTQQHMHNGMPIAYNQNYYNPPPPPPQYTMQGRDYQGFVRHEHSTNLNYTNQGM